MNGRIVFLVEEPSMKALLDGLLPRLLPDWEPQRHFQCVPHEGKRDLELSIARKLRAWREPGVRFVVVRDTDGADCVDLKVRLMAVCGQCGRPETLVRLVCQELESWYLGDLRALAAALGAPALDTPKHHKRYAQPDAWHKPSAEVRRLHPAFQKLAGARAMAAHLDPSTNRSHSFRVFASGVRRIAAEMRQP